VLRGEQYHREQIRGVDVIVTWLLAVPLSAQQSSTQHSDTIIVTATHTEIRVADTPASVVVLSPIGR
jgi:outer membrane receptor for ferrienterochelin and colicin